MFRMGVLRKKEDILLMAFIVIVGVFINSVVTGSMIFPQPRYMCYSMGLFYLLMSLVYSYDENVFVGLREGSGAIRIIIAVKNN
jgi:hypothetical protein